MMLWCQVTDKPVGVRMEEAMREKDKTQLTISMDDTGPMLLTYMPTSMSVGFSATDRGREYEHPVQCLANRKKPFNIPHLVT